MSQRDDLLGSICSTAADYRKGEVAAPSPAHVERWVRQFRPEVQLPLLAELAHVLESTYFSLDRTVDFLRSLLGTTKLTGDDPCAFWKRVSFLRIQRGGNSQSDMLLLIDGLIREICGVGIDQCGKDASVFVYVDDAIFTGNRVRLDLEAWIASDAPDQCTVHVATMALHSGAFRYAGGRIAKAAAAAGKQVALTWWRALELQDRNENTNSSDVLRPTIIPNDAAVNDYVQGMTYKPNLRVPGSVGENQLFSSEESRHLMEQELLIAGARIREQCPYLTQVQRPLGHMTLETLGFGSLIVTFRNCPNNAPLALWVDAPWYPLFPRVTNTQTTNRNLIARLREQFQ